MLRYRGIAASHDKEKAQILSSNLQAHHVVSSVPSRLKLTSYRTSRDHLSRHDSQRCFLEGSEANFGC